VIAAEPNLKNHQTRDYVNQIGAGNGFFETGENRESVPVSKSEVMAELKASLSAATVCGRHEMLAKRTTVAVGGGGCVFRASVGAELTRVLQICGRRGVPFFILGRGSRIY